ncbi:MAG: MATE family efflux transporter [Lachnospiraceae bacterium]|nr:MATE family efflux transporter [Lachnospiraceae bacterium]
MKSRVVDMTKGNTTRLLVNFMLPMLLGNLFQQLYNFVDSMIVGKFVGADALAAVGATSAINFLFFSLCNGLASGIGIVISQYFGAERDDDVRNTIGNALYIMGLSAFVMTVLGILLARPVLSFLRTPSNILNSSAEYMIIISSGIIFISSYNCVSAILRAVGDSKSPLYFLILSCFVNIGLDLLFVYVFRMGVAGAGIATILSQLIAALGSFLFALKTNIYFKLKKKDLSYNKIIVARSVKIGVPLAFQSSLIAISCVALQSVVNTFGSAVVAAFTATSRIEQLVQQPFNSLGMAVSTFTGQNIGAGNEARVKKGLWTGMAIMALFVMVYLPSAQFGGEFFISLFVNDAEVIALGGNALKITSWFYVFLGMIYVARGMLNGAGDAIFAFVNGFVEMLGRICFARPFTMIPGVGVWGVWLATGMTWCVTGIISLLRYLQGKWKVNVPKKVEINE